MLTSEKLARIGLIAVAAPAALWLIRTAYLWAKALISRRRSVRRLKRRCEDRGWSVEILNAGARSLFRPGGESLRVNADGVLYSCALVGGIRPAVPLMIRGDGVCSWIKSLTFLRVTFFTREKKRDLSWDSGAIKVFLIQPAPKKVLNKDMTPLDNGDSAAGCWIFTPAAFVNALERGALKKRAPRP